MRAFLAYSSMSKYFADSVVRSVKEECIAIEVEQLDKKTPFWKLIANRLIDSCDLLIVVSSGTGFSKNVNWEVEKAISKRIKVLHIYVNDTPILSEYSYNWKKDKTAIYKELVSISQELGSIDSKLINNTPDSDAEKVKILLDQYKLMISTSESLISRRQTANTFFLTANGVLISAIGYLIGKFIDINVPLYFLILLPIVGALICYAWYRLLDSYGQLNKGKFEIINRLENLLPARLFTAEWKALGEGRNPKIYRTFTRAEGLVPKIFIFLYLIYIIAIIAIALYYKIPIDQTTLTNGGKA